MSRTNLFVTFFEPSLITSLVAVAPDVRPVIVSFVTKFLLLMMIKLVLVPGTTTALAPLVEPVIISPLVNDPLSLVVVIEGNSGSVDASSESNTPQSLYASATPRDISL